jgi:micrococcal nuclease
MIMPGQVIDGDTLRDVAIKVGFDITVQKNVRLYGIDAPELREEKGQKAKERLRNIIGFCAETKLELEGTDAFGRALAILHCDGFNVNQKLVNEGFAVPYKRGK